MLKALDIAISENKAFDLLLSDISLRHGDGWELLRRLSEAGPHPAKQPTAEQILGIIEFLEAQQK